MGWEIVPNEQNYRDEIRKGEALAEAIWMVLPVFVTNEAVKRAGGGDFDAGTTIVSDVLLGLKVALRDYLCQKPELWLKEMESNPFPTPEEIEEMKAKAMGAPVIHCGRHGDLAKQDIACRQCVMEQVNPRPTVEQLMQASHQVQQFENALAKLDDLPAGVSEMAESLMRPQMEIQLEAARAYLSRMQKAMEEDTSPMSNEGKPGEGTVFE